MLCPFCFSETVIESSGASLPVPSYDLAIVLFPSVSYSVLISLPSFVNSIVDVIFPFESRIMVLLPSLVWVIVLPSGFV